MQTEHHWFADLDDNEREKWCVMIGLPLDTRWEVMAIYVRERLHCQDGVEPWGIFRILRWAKENRCVLESWGHAFLCVRGRPSEEAKAELRENVSPSICLEWRSDVLA